VSKLSKDFFMHDKVEQLAPLFLNKYLFSKMNGKVTGGKIVEVEAYAGRGRDKACHAHGNRTKRNESMFLEGGHSYVYLCYGIHHLFNIVTNKKEIPDAVLVRAIEPTHGVATILKRRRHSEIKSLISNGPGKVGECLGLSLAQDRASLRGNKVWLEDRGEIANEIWVGKRIGIDYAGKDVQLPWRFATSSRFVGHRKHLTQI
jgi:DNA-3-methyladenine glycosylase